MNIGRGIILTALLSFCLSCYGQSTDSITVAGRVYNVSDGMPHTLIINECDISIKSAREICELGEDGLFVKKIPLSFPHTLTINYNRNFINAFAAPGDSIYLDIDASTSPLSVTFGGDNADINQQYDPAFQYFSTFNYSRSLPADTVPLAEYLLAFKNSVEAGRDSINSYASRHHLSDEVVSMLYSDNIYLLANQAMGYAGRNLEEKRALFLDPTIFDVFNEDHTKVMIFPYHLSAIVNHFPDVRDNAPKGLIRDLMFACDEDSPAPDRNLFYNQAYYDRLYATDESVKEISAGVLKSGKIIVYQNGEIKEVQDGNPLTWLLSEFQGRPIYLDVSATWCGPCRAGLAGSESLRKHFKDTDVVFAVIWTQSSKDVWLKVAPTLSNITQIFIEDQEMMDRIGGYLAVKGFPTFFMIDKDGKIQKDVPRYQSPDLPAFLNKYR